MSRFNVWMPLYIGDYLADTGHLNAAQHGAYLLLLMHQWRTGPLPNDDIQLASIARVDLLAWRKSVAPIVRRFFDITPDGLSQKRLAAERAVALAVSEKRADAGRRGAGKRWTRGDEDGAEPAAPDGKSDDIANGKTMANAMAAPCDRQSQSQSQSPLPLHQGEDEPHPPLDSSSIRPVGSKFFEEFWNTYPRKVGRAEAQKAYKAALKAGTSPADILLGVRRQVFSPDQKFVPYPATWLRGERWLDDPKAAAPPPLERVIPSRTDWATAEIQAAQGRLRQSRSEQLNEMGEMVSAYLHAQRGEPPVAPKPSQPGHTGPTIDGEHE